MFIVTTCSMYQFKFNVSLLSLQHGWNALICASVRRHKNVVQQLLAAGANNTFRVSICVVSYIILYYHYVIRRYVLYNYYFILVIIFYHIHLYNMLLFIVWSYSSGLGRIK